ncbi:MAG TPA: hypothetical protein VJ964_07755 [Balneolaceae bacterium]|nr:hypothetical protein [Balneolaceae bacterium]
MDTAFINLLDFRNQTDVFKFSLDSDTVFLREKLSSLAPNRDLLQDCFKNHHFASGQFNASFSEKLPKKPLSRCWRHLGCGMATCQTGCIESPDDILRTNIAELSKKRQLPFQKN